MLRLLTFVHLAFSAPHSVRVFEVSGAVDKGKISAQVRDSVLSNTTINDSQSNVKCREYLKQCKCEVFHKIYVRKLLQNALKRV